MSHSFSGMGKQDAIPTSINIDFAHELMRGLAAEDRFIPCRFLYDARGSELFEQITDLPEYYLTRTETAILERCCPQIAESVPNRCTVVEFGSGSSRKTEILLRDLGEKVSRYIAIDISDTALEEATARLDEQFPNIDIVGIKADFYQPVSMPELDPAERLIGFFPGSTIGNSLPGQSVMLLSSMRTTLGSHARLIIGTDLVKDIDVLKAAYDDSAGVTAEFNLNILQHANEAVGTNFVVSQFEHHIEWNPVKQRIEIYLRSLVRQTVNVLGRSFRIEAGDLIHTENSHKYTVEGFRSRVSTAGWQPRRVWRDARELFAVHELAAC